jgi:hypothetical protein
MNAIAALTGGVAYGRDDVDAAFRQAMDDRRVGYTLGFYPPGDKCASAIHRLTVRARRPGMVLRYRASNQTECSPSVAADPKAELVKALSRPFDASTIPIKASVTRAQDRLNLLAVLDLPSLELTLSRDRWKGRIEIIARFAAADGSQAGELVSQTLSSNLPQETYDAALPQGVAYHIELKIPPKAVELKLMVANLAAGKTGTLTIPLSQIEASAANVK